MAAETKTEFETEVCSRCGGTGHYSYNQMDGSKCYGCGGKGIKLTKRGAAARELYMRLLSKPATEIAVGDKIHLDSMYSGWYTVASVTIKSNGQIDLDFTPGAKMGGYVCNPTEVIRYAHTEEQKAPKLAAALAYQDTLTKAGKPRK